MGLFYNDVQSIITNPFCLSHYHLLSNFRYEGIMYLVRCGHGVAMLLIYVLITADKNGLLCRSMCGALFTTVDCFNLRYGILPSISTA